MASRLTDRLARRLRFVPSGTEPGTDADLLRRFTQHRDEEAFADLVHRHGPVVLAVCRRALGDTPDAEDAFQATFLVLARRAGAIRRGGSVGCWLYGVALRVSRKACRRRPPPPVASARPGPPDPAHEAAWRELAEMLDEELARLPHRLRDPLVLCYLHGRTRDEAAAELGWSLSTLKRRLDRAREVLRARLTGRGIAPPMGLLGAVGMVWGPPAAAVPAPLRMTTLAAVTGKAAGVSAAQRLADGVLAGSGLVRVKLVVGALLAIAVVAVGVGLACGPAAPPEVTQPTPPAKTEPPPVVAAPPATPPVDPLRPGAVAWLGGGSLRITTQGSGRLSIPADSRTVFSVSDERCVTQWDLLTGQVLRRLTNPGSIVSGDAAVSADGKLLAAVVHRPDGIALWDVEREVVLWRTPLMGAARARTPSLSLSPDGRVLAVWGMAQESISLWDTTQRKVYATLPVGRSNFAVFTSDNKKLITTSLSDAAIRVWDVATGAGRMSLAGPADRTWALAVSPDGKMLACAGNAGLRVDLWDLTTGRTLRAFEGGPDFPSLTFSPDGQQLYSSNPGRTVVWTVGTGKVERQLEMAGADRIRPGRSSGTLSPDGRTFLAKNSSVIQVYDTTTGKERFPVIGHTESVRKVAFSPDGRTLVSNGRSSDLKFWDTQTGRVVNPFPKPLALSEIFAWSNDGRALAVAGSRGVVIHDAKSGAELHRLDLPRSHIRSMVFVGTGGPLVIDDHNSTVSIWGWAGKGAVTPLAGVKKDVTALAASRDGRWVAVAAVSQDSEVGLWDAATGKQVRALVLAEKDRDSVFAIIFSLDSKTVAVSMSNVIQLYDVADGAAAQKFKTGFAGWIGGVAFSPDGGHFAAASHEGPVYIRENGR